MANKTVPEPVYARIGRRIEMLRVAKRLSQVELARRLPTPLQRASISNIEGGRQRLMLHTLLEIAEVLGVDPGSILSTEPILGDLARTEGLHDTLMSMQLSAATIAGLHARLESHEVTDEDIDA